MNTHISPHNSHSWLQGKSLKGTLSDFDSHQERRLSSLEAQLGRQQDDMVNKINVLWKVFFEKLDDTSTCNTAGDSMAHVNATSTDQIRRKITRKNKIGIPKAPPFRQFCRHPTQGIEVNRVGECEPNATGVRTIHEMTAKANERLRKKRKMSFGGRDRRRKEEKRRT
ncbi:hypothetical protein Tco_0291180 [Tanacetum coccineum]